MLVSARPYEISVGVSEAALPRYGTPFDEVERAVERSSLALPGGSLRTDAAEIPELREHPGEVTMREDRVQHRFGITTVAQLGHGPGGVLLRKLLPVEVMEQARPPPQLLVLTETAGGGAGAGAEGDR